MCQVGSPNPGYVKIKEEDAIFVYRKMARNNSYYKRGLLRGVRKAWAAVSMQAECGGSNAQCTQHIKDAVDWCDCGINGVFKRANTRGIDGYPNDIIVLCKAWGHVYMGSKGVRATRTKMVGIFESSKGASKLVEEAAAYYKLPILSREKKKQNLAPKPTRVPARTAYKQTGVKF